MNSKKIILSNKIGIRFIQTDRGTEDSCPLCILLHCPLTYEDKGCEYPVFVRRGRLNGKGGEK